MIDWTRVNTLRSEVGEEDFAEIAGLFLEELAEVIGSLSTAPDPSVLSDGYHSLKGSALNLGFSEVARLCAAGEADPGSADLDAIKAACAASQDELLGHFPEIAA